MALMTFLFISLIYHFRHHVDDHQEAGHHLTEGAPLHRRRPQQRPRCRWHPRPAPRPAPHGREDDLRLGDAREGRRRIQHDQHRQAVSRSTVNHPSHAVRDLGITEEIW